MNLDQKIEAILFWKGEPMSAKKLGVALDVEEEKIIEAVPLLKEKLQGRGIALIEKDAEYMLVASGEASELIEKLAKEELNKDLGKASLETLSIILYQGPVKRSELDYIRGVNSQFILRNLLVRGLIEKIPDPKDGRTFIYKPSFELLSHLNVSSVSEMPEYQEVRTAIENFKLANAEPKQPAQTQEGEDTNDNNIEQI